MFGAVLFLLDFLSRLCGGERFSLKPSASYLFLSRLCGGELAWLGDTYVTNFLSRLCGGERRLSL
ncbi:hypothetical protein SPWS13_0643 [Shewanella putrefaciens]|nr:hypothetical protein SPWS13_0643 [Shewanella putrefaciens]